MTSCSRHSRLSRSTRYSGSVYVATASHGVAGTQPRGLAVSGEVCHRAPRLVIGRVQTYILNNTQYSDLPCIYIPLQTTLPTLLFLGCGFHGLDEQLLAHLFNVGANKLLNVERLCWQLGQLLLQRRHHAVFLLYKDSRHVVLRSYHCQSIPGVYEGLRPSVVATIDRNCDSASDPLKLASSAEKSVCRASSLYGSAYLG